MSDLAESTAAGLHPKVATSLRRYQTGADIPRAHAYELAQLGCVDRITGTTTGFGRRVLKYLEEKK
ncbi:hypothetical protein OS127_03020 [Corynebacterium sp. P6129]|uniref:hypothetical protein n=1 Tax=Corynebacterium antarcticum TaxID=2800405 RepID=UPI002260C13C|nr:hypothetical protein [Corynebacterium antarcticum]MCX7491500.1 hypothetical protein [Corynebacterium antarcticum]